MFHITLASDVTSSLKVFLLLIAAISHNVGLKPPNPSPSKAETVYKGQFFENLVHLLALACRVSFGFNVSEEK